MLPDLTCCLVNGCELGGGIWSVLLRREALAADRHGEGAAA
jgi:hypothetical protein